jgi:arylsulfatase A-like enzyme
MIKGSAMIMKRILFGACSVGAILSTGQAFAGVERERPNIVIILADDLGYGDCGAYNKESKIDTPQIDQLAREGLLFLDAHAAGSTCTPSRYGLLTGINPVRTGVLNTSLQKGKTIIDEDEATIATMLRDLGYATMMIGKWHLGFQMNTTGNRPVFDFSKPLMGGPMDRGFESFYGIHSSPGASPLFYIRGRSAVELPAEKGTVRNNRGSDEPVEAKVMMSPGYRPVDASPSFCDEAVEQIHAHAASDKSKPLFLYYASTVPHQPWVPSAAFKGKSGLGDYGDFVMQLDDVVGRINSALKETGLDKNTLLIFTSDNGPGPWAYRAMKEVGHASSAALRGSKADAWEGGHRVPFIVKWPERVAANTQTKAVINFTDLFLTVAKLLEVDVLNTYPRSAKDSVSFLSVLLDPSQEYKRQAMMFGRGFVREESWKLVSKTRVREMDTVEQSQFELFHLQEDLSEQKDQSIAHPERVERLFQAYRKYAESRELK